MRVKVSSILDQSSDREVDRATREDLNALRGRFESLEGEDPMKAEEVTDDQLSVLAAVTKAGVTLLASFQDRSNYVRHRCGCVGPLRSQFSSACRKVLRRMVSLRVG